MKKPYQLIITCPHNDPRNIIRTLDGESVCRCGVVLEEKMPDGPSAESQSTPTLYHLVENGGSPRDMKVVNKNIHIYTSSASEFSNICSKLGLLRFIQQRAWSIYHTLRSKTYYTRAKCATFAIYVACREADQPIDEYDIRQAVMSVLCVKNAPSSLGAISEMHEDAQRLGINTNEGHSSGYYLHLEISKRQGLFGDPRDYDRFTARVMECFSHIRGNPQNRAERAVMAALSRMGMTQ